MLWGNIMEKNWAHSVDQCWLQVLRFLVHLISLLGMLLTCNGFAKIQKAVVVRQAADHQTATMTFFGTSVALGSALELLLGLVIAGCQIKSAFCCMSQSS